MKMNWKALVRRLKLAPHPEGGYYRENYRSKGLVPAAALRKTRHKGARGFSTAIYYLLPGGVSSKLHRLKSDEIFHFYLGTAMTLLKLGPRGEIETVRLAHDGEVQHVVPAGWWFGGWCDRGYALVGCTVAPAFDFADFEMADGAALARRYPKARKLIARAMGPSPRSR